MFKKIMCSFLLVSAILTSPGHASTSKTLKEVFDDLSYSLNVEWDQKDQNFYDAKIELLKTQVSELKKNGLSTEDFLNFARTQIKDEKVVRDLTESMNILAYTNMSDKEVVTFLLKNINPSYSQGASWDTGVVLSIAIPLIMIIIAGSLIAKGDNPGDMPYCYQQCGDLCEPRENGAFFCLKQCSTVCE